MEDLKVLAINSFPVHGMAGLKTSMAILGQRVLPVPSVILNGLTNMPGVKKQFTDFKELLHGTFELVVHRKQQVLLSIGYIGQSSQVDIILEAIALYKDNIKMIFTDPIAGDHGRQYVPDEIVARWPELVALSDYVFPNMTELGMLTGSHAPSQIYFQNLIERFRSKFPSTRLIVTSINEENQIGILAVTESEQFKYLHEKFPVNYSGTGDAFKAFFILLYIYHDMPMTKAIQLAAEKVQECLSNSIESNSDELVITNLSTQYVRSEA
jgi:pyridoxine kinase